MVLNSEPRALLSQNIVGMQPQVIPRSKEESSEPGANVGGTRCPGHVPQEVRVTRLKCLGDSKFGRAVLVRTGSERGLKKGVHGQLELQRENRTFQIHAS